MHRKFFCLTVIAGIAASFPALSNDSTARLGAGGLELTQSKSIRMVDEFLSISQDSVFVRYEFRNDSAVDEKTIVAFPMPRLWWNPGESASDANVKPLTGFKTLVAGNVVPTKVSTKAWFGRRDITRILSTSERSDGELLSYVSCSVETVNEGKCIDASLAKKVNALVPGAIDKSSRIPNFEVQQTAFWEQVFPATASLRIDHSYAPKVGQTWSTYRGNEIDFEPPRQWAPGRNNGVESTKAACLDEGVGEALRRRVQRLAKLNEGYVAVTLNDVEYVLGTGRNWKGPIESFVMHVVKNSPDQLVSLCFPGKSRKVDDLTLEFSAKNFVPQDKLIVYFYTVETEKQMERKNEAERAKARELGEKK
jgi:hypothetical protein